MRGCASSRDDAGGANVTAKSCKAIQELRLGVRREPQIADENLLRRLRERERQPALLDGCVDQPIAMNPALSCELDTIIDGEQTFAANSRKKPA